MIFVLRLIGVVVLAAVAVLAFGLWDLAENNGRMFSWLAGRDTLVKDCTPPLRENLIGRGFSPIDVTFGDDEAVGFLTGSFGRRRNLSSSFSFSDGENGPRVDGHLVCTVAGHSIQVEVHVDALPRRVT